MIQTTLFVRSLVVSSIVLSLLFVVGGCGRESGVDRVQPATENNNQSNQPIQNETVQVVERDAEMSLVADRHNLKEGEEFEAGVELINNQVIDGVDVILKYDSELLQILDEHVIKGDILDTLIFEQIDQEKGEVRFSVISKLGQPSQESGLVAWLHFKAIQAGQAEIAFDFKESLTTDTNVASGGNDILGKVSGLELEIEKQ